MKSDADIRHALENELCWDPSIDERAIHVTVSGGIVHLRGEVAECGERYTAEDIALRTIGVKGVENNLRVLTAEPRSDAEIELAAINSLRWLFSGGATDIRVTAAHGWITLQGRVNCRTQASVAENAIRCLQGVTGVTNRVSWAPGVPFESRPMWSPRLALKAGRA
jgi:osmotically-inducible protein OsmY